MNISNQITKTAITSGDLKFELLQSGDFFAISYKDQSVSMYKATALDGMMANIYLRLTKNGKSSYTRLLGVNSPSKFEVHDHQLNYAGNFMGVDYLVNLKLNGLAWFWTVKVKGNDPEVTGELFYGQDISLNSPWANEAYTCQYLDHTVLKEKNGYHVVTKQNQGMPLMLQQGSLTENAYYATDGFDFFGLRYKFDNQPEVLEKGNLPNVNYQYELAYIAFQTPAFSLNKPYEAIFYACLTPNFYDTDRKVLSLAEVRSLYEAEPLEAITHDFHKVDLAISWQNTYPYHAFSEGELKMLFPGKLLEEHQDGKLLSWFNEDGTHFVTGDKERYLERAHGNIIINNGMRPIEADIMTSTNWIYGIFNSQIALNNSQFNKMINNNKTPLNIMKTSGERLFVRVDGEYQLLAMPAVYEMDINASTWYYKIKDDIVKIQTAIANTDNLIVLNVRSMNGLKYDFILTDQMIMGNDDYAHPIHYEIEGNRVRFTFDEHSMTYQKYPQYHFVTTLQTDGLYQYAGDEIYFMDQLSRNNPIFSIIIGDASNFTLSVNGFTTSEEHFQVATPLSLKEEYQASHLNNLNHIKLDIDPTNKNHDEIMKFNMLIPWYVHNALVHYASPHGLEQYGGGAWGTRDVCQGPTELFEAFNRYDLVKQIILKVYGRQFIENGDWPQWFMYDEFRYIQADSSHGDVIVWPLYIVGNYISATGDKGILNTKVPYTSLKTGQTTEAVSLYEHIKKQIDTIRSHFLEGTHLSSYGGGDWDDTLQPSNRDLTKRMVSGWTVALTIEALEGFNEAVDEELGFKDLASDIKKDFQKYLLADNIPAGFIYMGDSIRYMLHPRDEVTGLKYRLLPFNQGMIGELFDQQNLSKYLDIIDEQLMHPDGVRLMNTTVKYQGGTPKIFMRAETATNFGREIGLMYVHAHIRYLEAMAKIGEAERLYKGLRVINPILIRDNVPNAVTRQSNTYYSSSDGDFKNRYEADRKFDLLRTGEVPVKAGWRLYSSGPGIYLKQLIGNFLGIKEHQNSLYLDPVLPKSLDGLHCEYDYHQHHLRITYEITGSGSVDYVIINGKKISRNTAFTKYRPSGVSIPRSMLKDNNDIIIKM